MDLVIVLTLAALGLACVVGALMIAARGARRTARCRACRRELVVQGFQCVACGADLRDAGIISAGEGSPRVWLAGLFLVGMAPLGCLGSCLAASWGPARVVLDLVYTMESPRSRAYGELKVRCTVDRTIWGRESVPANPRTQRAVLTLKAATGTHRLEADLESGEYSYTDSQGLHREGKGLTPDTLKQWFTDLGVAADDPSALALEIADIWDVMLNNRGAAVSKGFGGRGSSGGSRFSPQPWFMLLVLALFLGLAAGGVWWVLARAGRPSTRSRPDPQGDRGAATVTER